MKKSLIIVFSILVVLIAIVALLFNHFFYSMSNLPTGTFLSESISPKGDYLVKTYVTNGGATGSLSVRGEVIKNISGSKKNFYWDYKVDKADIYWVSDYVVQVNGHKIDIRKESYDWRKH